MVCGKTGRRGAGRLAAPAPPAAGDAAPSDAALPAAAARWPMPWLRLCRQHTTSRLGSKGDGRQRHGALAAVAPPAARPYTWVRRKPWGSCAGTGAPASKLPAATRRCSRLQEGTLRWHASPPPPPIGGRAAAAWQQQPGGQAHAGDGNRCTACTWRGAAACGISAVPAAAGAAGGRGHRDSGACQARLPCMSGGASCTPVPRWEQCPCMHAPTSLNFPQKHNCRGILARQELRCRQAERLLLARRLQRMLQRWREVVAAQDRLRRHADLAGQQAFMIHWQRRQQLLTEHGPGGLAAAHSQIKRLGRAWTAWVQAAAGL